MDVRPHPHINLATVTYLFAGEIVHKDSLRVRTQAIRPGDLNWMTAGRGIVHSERTGDALRKSGSAVHGIQSWVALPAEDEEAEPSFQHIPGKSLPELGQPGVRMRIIAGTAFGATAPVQVMSPLFYVEAQLDAGAELALPDEYAERAAYVVEGTIDCGGARVATNTMAVAEEGARATIRALERSHVMLLGGAPLGQALRLVELRLELQRADSNARRPNGRFETRACSRKCRATTSSTSRFPKSEPRVAKGPRSRCPYGTVSARRGEALIGQRSK